MKNISPALQAHLSGDILTIATCWKLTRRDGEVLGFTDHDTSLLIDGVNYMATTGLTASALESTTTLDVDNMDVQGMLSADAITEADIVSGVYDDALIDVFIVNTHDLSQGTMPLRTGWLGEITVRDKQFIAELRGLTHALGSTIGNVFSPACRAQFGDAACGVDTANYTVEGSITQIHSPTIIEDASRAETAGHFTNGVITMLSGANEGLSNEVKSFQQGRFILSLPWPFPLATGDAYRAVAGCDKQFTTCKTRFNNALNFRGEPHVPGLDRMLQTAVTAQR